MSGKGSLPLQPGCNISRGLTLVSLHTSPILRAHHPPSHLFEGGGQLSRYQQQRGEVMMYSREQQVKAEQSCLCPDSFHKPRHYLDSPKN